MTTAFETMQKHLTEWEAQELADYIDGTTVVTDEAASQSREGWVAHSINT